MLYSVEKITELLIANRIKVINYPKMGRISKLLLHSLLVCFWVAFKFRKNKKDSFEEWFARLLTEF